MTFTGFDPHLLAFFQELSRNNNKEWFAANKPRYEQEVVQPMLAFIEAMGPRLFGISPHFQAIPKKVGGSLFRIYKDVRFSKDKTPYKEHAACQFRHEAGKDAHAPGYYLHMAPHEVFFGGGVWLPPPDKLGLIRDRIRDKPEEWQKVREAMDKHRYFKDIEGETLRRPPKGYDKDLPFIEDIKRKSFFVMRTASPAEVVKPEFITEVAQTYAEAAPLMRFLCKAVAVSY